MANFIYTIADKHGHRTTGSIDAPTRADAVEMIRKKDWYVVSLKSRHEADGDTAFRSRATMTTLERILFTDHLASMIESGTPISEALETFGEEGSGKIPEIVRTLVYEIQQGRKLSDALSKYPYIFTSYYTSLVAAGELSGRLDQTFLHLSKELRREYEFKERIKSALIYPALVLTVAVLVIIMLVFLVIPKITELTKSFGGDLPLSTRIVAGASGLLTDYAPLVMAISAVCIFALIAAYRNPKTKVALDPYMLRVPLLGRITRYYTLARLLRLIGSCLSYGIPLSVTFDAVEQVMGNKVYKDVCIRLKNRVVKGMDLAQAMGLEGTFIFPSLVVRSVRGAEKTGTVDSALLRLSMFFESDVDRNLKRMTDLIEPTLTIILGVIVGGIALAVIGPIYQLTSKIH